MWLGMEWRRMHQPNAQVVIGKVTENRKIY